MMRMIKKCFIRLDLKLLRFTRPLLEFAVPVWSPMLKGDIDMLERVQHRATRLMISLRELSYGERLQALDLTTLVERRQRGDMIQIFKIFKGIDRMETYERYCFLRNLTRVHCFKYNKEISRQTHRENFLLNRAANYWNELPKEVISAETVNIFKAGLDCWMSSN
jgi:ribonuclease P/MRP protein subunit RPP40